MEYNIPVYCSFNKEVYDAGDAVTALIRSPSCPEEAVIFAQAIGIFQIDGRWVKVPSSYFDGNDVVLVSGILPQSLRNNSLKNILVFSTTHEALPLSHVCDEGVYIQFDIPQDALPSFVGIAGSIVYMISISIQLPSETIRCHFQFRVFGPGSKVLSNRR